MTLTAEYDFGHKRFSQSATKLDGGRCIARLGLRILAVALLLTGAGLWILPGSSWQSEVLLFKLILSVTAALGGLGLWQMGMTPSPPVVELDLERSEVRLVRECGPAARRLIEACRFEDLGGAEQNGRQITFWTTDGRLLAEITLSNATAHATLISALRNADKLA